MGHHHQHHRGSVTIGVEENRTTVQTSGARGLPPHDIPGPGYEPPIAVSPAVDIHVPDDATAAVVVSTAQEDVVLQPGDAQQFVVGPNGLTLAGQANHT